jgi:hypothetical protein
VTTRHLSGHLKFSSLKRDPFINSTPVATDLFVA